MNDRNPYEAPKAEVRDVGDEPSANIDALPVSNTWKNRFRLIEQAGGTRLPYIKDLQFGDRMKVMFNILAFLFGPFYFLAKGLWRKAITYVVCGVILFMLFAVALSVIGLDSVTNALSWGLSVFFAMRANVDYYKRMALNDNGWW